FIVSANLVIILVISRERSLHEPMYMFIALLSVNSLYGSTGFFPRFLMDLVSDSHLISRPACFTQIYVIYTYGCWLSGTAHYRVTLFILTLLCYCVIWLVNVTIIVTIIVDKNLHEPMYIFLWLSGTVHYRVTLFILTLLCYFVIWMVNVTIIVTIIVDRNLHEPMYIFLWLSGTAHYRVTLFILTLLCYCVIWMVNVTIIVTIIVDRNLHEPMYIFLCNLCINAL
ncbi:unnamed protein product, partial [Pleuronectes platessa]